MKYSAICLFCCVWTLSAGAADWPQWRGPQFNGVAEGAAPLEWSDSKNVAWKTPIPGRGFSTPVVWGDTIFLTTAIPMGEAKPAEAPKPPDAPKPEGPSPGSPGARRGPGGGSGGNIEHRFVVMALNRRTGAVEWEQTAATAVTHEGYHARYGSFASYAPVTDGKHVWALFGSYGLYCYDMKGKLVWKKELPKMKMVMSFGEGGAPVLAGGRLILKLDQESGSFIAVLDKLTGKEIWRKEREERSSWSNPLVVDHGGKKLVIASASAKTRAYDLETGDVIWEVAGLGGNVIPAPVLAGDVVVVMSGFRNPNQLAIKLGGKGDLTGTEAVLWSNQRGNSYTPSPVLEGGKMYFLTDNGLLSCVNPVTGEAYYRQQRLGKPYNFKASPVAAAGRLYLASEEGDVVVVKLGEQFEVLATNTLTDQFFEASPVITNGSLYLRSDKALYCIREK
ncbi:MAG: PQQ-like beta-propeller repeat protein [Acidobacteria bacterium]|nr:PQQ-like beta-propeller repeat protein [Acidobacteriota bacterium]